MKRWAMLNKPGGAVNVERAMNLKSYRESAEDFFDGDGRTDTAFAHALGWLSIGIGLSELAAPKQIEEMLGINHDQETRGTLRVLGMRELCHGVALLSERELTPQLARAVWARVAGDVLDTSLFGLAGTKTNRPTSYAIAGAVLTGIGALDYLCAKRLSRELQ